MPIWAREQELCVYRACATGEVDRESFLNSFEENGFYIKSDEGQDETNPSLYSLSTYTKYKDVKRFAKMTSRFGVPFVIAEGKTNPECGICLETKEWYRHLGKKTNSSHVDYWLYESAEPWLDFHKYVHAES